jgi:pseudaminic acid synthase
MSPSLEIAGRPIGPAHPVYIVAEMSANHRGGYHAAVDILHAAKACGADAVKLQTYTPDTMTLRCGRPEFRIGEGSPWEGRTLYDLYAEAHTPWAWHRGLLDEARRIGLTLFSTPFDAGAVDFLEALAVPAYKVASFENVDLALIRRVAATGRPTILSTGMATREELEEAVAAFRAAGGRGLALLKCTSAYPAPAADMNLRTLPDLARRFDAPAGLSDHTRGIAAAVTAVALGACIIEKHFTLSHDHPGPDDAFSLDPAQFSELVQAVRVAEQALGTVRYGPTPNEAPMRRLRRSLFVVRDVAKGEPFDAENLRAIRPGHGLPPKHYPEVLGRRATRDIARGTPLSWDLVATQDADRTNGGEGIAVGRIHSARRE